MINKIVKVYCVGGFFYYGEVISILEGILTLKDKKSQEIVYINQHNVISWVIEDGI